MLPPAAAFVLEASYFPLWAVQVDLLRAVYAGSSGAPNVGQDGTSAKLDDGDVNSGVHRLLGVPSRIDYFKVALGIFGLAFNMLGWSQVAKV